MSHTKKGSAIPRFKVGDKVRVNSGVSDPDFPDMPLGGWTGTVTEIIEHEGQINCVFNVDDRTLKSLHPIYHGRCERDGLDFEAPWGDGSSEGSVIKRSSWRRRNLRNRRPNPSSSAKP
jgi:hypothetical protein